MALIPFIQSSYTGMNRQVDPSNLATGLYALLVNARIRNGGPEPIGLPLDLTTSLPSFKNIQGIYGFDNFLVVFGDGLAYTRNYDLSSVSFSPVPGFSMDPNVDFIYALEVPASTVNYVRIPTSSSGVPQASGPITLTASYEGATACIICQDGINQPRLILPNGTSRVSQTFYQWSQNGVREYIPVGTVMLYVNNKVYCLVKDGSGNYTLIASSVSGRPCDFMVDIDTNGNAGAFPGYVAYSVSYTPLTCMSATGGSTSTNGQGTSFYVASQNFSYLVNPNYNITIFGEPTYTNQSLFTTGPNNNWSIIDLLGDTAIIDAGGIRSFNSILQTRFEGRSSPFSSLIQPFFGDVDDVNSSIIQTTTAGIQFADYGFFAVRTIYGIAVCVYDTTFQSWVAIDIFPGLTSPIKQFADIKTTEGIRELFFITEDNHFYQYLAGATSTAGFYAGDYTPIGNGLDVKPIQVNPVFTRVVESGMVNLNVFMDSKLITTLSKSVIADKGVNANSFNTYPLTLPFGTNNADLTRSPSFDLSKIEQGWKMGFWITWNFKAMLLLVQAAGDGKLIQNSLKQQARDYGELQTYLNPTQSN